MAIQAEQEAKVYQAVLVLQDALAYQGKRVSMDALVLQEIQDTLVVKVGHCNVIKDFFFFCDCE